MIPCRYAATTSVAVAAKQPCRTVACCCGLQYDVTGHQHIILWYKCVDGGIIVPRREHQPQRSPRPHHGPHSRQQQQPYRGQAQQQQQQQQREPASDGAQLRREQSAPSQEQQQHRQGGVRSSSGGDGEVEGGDAGRQSSGTAGGRAGATSAGRGRQVVANHQLNFQYESRGPPRVSN